LEQHLALYRIGSSVNCAEEKPGKKKAQKGGKEEIRRKHNKRK